MEMVQHASLRTLSFLCDSSASRFTSTPFDRTFCVCESSPVTMLPTVRSAGVTTLCEGWLPSEHSEAASLLEQLDQAAHNARVDDFLDAVVGAVGQVGQGPARVRQHLVVGVED